MNPRNLFILIVFLSLVLAACGASAPASNSPLLAPTTASISGAVNTPLPEDLSRTDEQGAVVITIKPLNLYNSGETLDFEVVMNTHSVELGMNLATLATLTTDTGFTVQAVGWDAPGGGHHVSGKLSFPASMNGTLLLEKSAKLTLTVRNVDAPERIFKWEISK